MPEPGAYPILPTMLEPAGGLSTLGALFARIRPLQELSIMEKLDLLADIALQLEEEARAMVDRVIALEGRVSELERKDKADGSQSTHG